MMRITLSDTESGAKAVIDGQIVEDSRAFALGGENEKLHVGLYDPHWIGVVLSRPLMEIGTSVSSLEIPTPEGWDNLVWQIELDFEPDRRNATPMLRAKLAWESEEWAGPVSMAEYAITLQKAAADLASDVSFYRTDDDFLMNGWGLEMPLTVDYGIAEERIRQFGSEVAAVLSSVAANLAQMSRKNSLVTFFDFPPAIRNASEQYLLYFIQFLEDLGIKAEGEIKEQANRVLFSVTPADGTEALEKIREALDAYLQLPGASDFDKAANQSHDIALQQLQANVYHLKSQIALSHAVLQAKHATIEALQLANYQYRQMLMIGGELGSQVVSNTSRISESFPLVGDTVHIKKYEGKLLSVDVPTLLRRLKRIFGP